VVVVDDLNKYGVTKFCESHILLCVVAGPVRGTLPVVVMFYALNHLRPVAGIGQSMIMSAKIEISRGMANYFHHNAVNFHRNLIKTTSARSHMTPDAMI
jgi:hypothetical protein